LIESTGSFKPLFYNPHSIPSFYTETELYSLVTEEHRCVNNLLEFHARKLQLQASTPGLSTTDTIPAELLIYKELSRRTVDTPKNVQREPFETRFLSAVDWRVQRHRRVDDVRMHQLHIHTRPASRNTTFQICTNYWKYHSIV